MKKQLRLKDGLPLGKEADSSFLLLACEVTSYMTGQILHPNGGTIANG